MELLALSDGGLSLEFQSFEAPVVIEALRAEGEVKVERSGLYQTVHLADAELLYVDEWDSPCLIAGDAPSTALLRRIMLRALSDD